MYIHHRLNHLIGHFKQRVPFYFTFRIFSQIVQVGGSIIISAFAIWGYLEWTAAVSIVVAAVAAYVEFHGTESKLQRTSAMIHGLKELIAWWETLPDIDRASGDKIDRLITTAEDMLNRDFMAWRSTSQAIKMLKQIVDESKNKQTSTNNKQNTVGLITDQSPKLESKNISL